MLYTIVKLNPDDLVVSPLTRVACTYCSKFDTNWSCPPVGGFKIDVLLRKLQKFRNIYMIVFYFPQLYKWFPKNISKNLQWVFTQRLLAVEVFARRKTLTVLNVIRSRVGNCLIFKTGGACTKCRTCNYLLGKPCVNPQELMFSPEACSINIYKTLSNFGIPFEHPVRNYVVKVGLVLTNDVLNIDKLGIDFEYVDFDVLRKSNIYKLLGIEKRLNLELTSVKRPRFVVLEERKLVDVISKNVDLISCRDCRFYKICSLLRESYENLIKYGQSIHIHICRTESMSNEALYKIWHRYAQRHTIALICMNNFVKHRNKYVAICKKLLHIDLKLGRNEIIILFE